MHWLLNFRLLAGAAIAVALAFSHFFVYRAGRADMRVQLEREMMAKALSAEQAARQREQDLVIARNKSEERYVQEKRKAASAAATARGELDRLRSELAAPGVGATCENPAASARANGAVGLERELLGHCAATLVGLAAEADRLEATVVGLQSYVKDVCQKQ